MISSKAFWILNLVWLILLLSLGLIFGIDRFLLKNQLDRANEQLTLEKAQFEELAKGLARAESKLITEKQLKELMEQSFGEQLALIEKDLKDLKAKPYIIQNTSTMVEGDTTYINGDFPRHHDFLTKQGMEVAEYTYTDASPGSPGGLLATTHDYRITISSLVSKTRDDILVGHVQGTISSSADRFQNTYPLSIEDSTISFVDTNKKTFMFAPHIDAGLQAGYGFKTQSARLGGSIGFSFFAVGETKSDNDVRFLRIRGTFDDKSIGVGIDPILLNIAKPIPVVDDIYLSVGPTFHSNEDISIQAGISSTF